MGTDDQKKHWDARTALEGVESLEKSKLSGFKNILHVNRFLFNNI